jgi:DNA adenine methylase
MTTIIDIDNARRPGTVTAPFPWYGGKRRVAHLVWQALGDVDLYVEPFAGSLACLLARAGEPRLEVANDADCYVANFWRAVQADPRGVARYADWPVNEVDLYARHLWLVHTAHERIQRIRTDPHFYDAKVAGWWVWGISQWIGGRWCSPEGVGRHMPELRGQGVHAQGRRDLAGEMERLSARLRRVKICCGDWSRVVSDGALNNGKTVGVLLDPPYDLSERSPRLYNVDAVGISRAARDWCARHGSSRRMRLVLCGYEGEHKMPRGWRVIQWAGGNPGAIGGKGGRNAANRLRERLWLSPHCLDVPDAERIAA